MLYNKKHIYLRSPMRISFAGGGTDLESYYRENGEGHVVSTTIDLYTYVSMKDMFDANVRIHHSEIETESIASRIKHNYARTALEHYGLFRGIEIVLTSDVMTTGSGLGASSAMMASLIKGCSHLREQTMEDPYVFAEKIYQLEQEAGTIGGKQDQYATVFGGLNSISFSGQETQVENLQLSNNNIKELESRFFLVFTNLARSSHVIQQELEENVGNRKNKSKFKQILDLSYEFKKALTSPNLPLDTIGELLHESWMIKKASNKQSTNVYIDQLYESLRKKGILGGKILGAGGGGFLLAYAKDPALKKKIKYELYPNFIALDLKFTKQGTEVIWKNF